MTYPVKVIAEETRKFFDAKVIWAAIRFSSFHPQKFW